MNEKIKQLATKLCEYKEFSDDWTVERLAQVIETLPQLPPEMAEAIAEQEAARKRVTS